MAGELHGQIAGEAACILDQNHPNRLSLTVGQQGRKTGPGIDRIATADRRVVEATRNGVTPLGVSLDGICLAHLAIFVCPNVCGAARPIIGNCYRILAILPSPFIYLALSVKCPGEQAETRHDTEQQGPDEASSNRAHCARLARQPSKISC
jgi:hypothetical protein